MKCPDCRVTGTGTCLYEPMQSDSPELADAKLAGCARVAAGSNWDIYRTVDHAGQDPTEAFPGASPADLVKVTACTKRSTDCGCLSKPAQCDRDPLPRIVMLDDCLACIRAGLYPAS